MTQYHYVVGYDDETDKWFVEHDTTAYFPDGNMFDPAKAQSDEWGYYGWFMPEDDHPEVAIDEKCMNMLNALVTIWPSPVVNGEL